MRYTSNQDGIILSFSDGVEFPFESQQPKRYGNLAFFVDLTLCSRNSLTRVWNCISRSTQTKALIESVMKELSSKYTILYKYTETSLLYLKRGALEVLNQSPWQAPIWNSLLSVIWLPQDQHLESVRDWSSRSLRTSWGVWFGPLIRLERPFWFELATFQSWIV